MTFAFLCCNVIDFTEDSDTDRSRGIFKLEIANYKRS